MSIGSTPLHLWGGKKKNNEKKQDEEKSEHEGEKKATDHICPNWSEAKALPWTGTDISMQICGFLFFHGLDRWALQNKHRM